MTCSWRRIPDIRKFRMEDIHDCKELTVLAESEEAGLFLAMADGGRKIFVMGHPEYDRVTLDGEYKRDVSKKSSDRDSRELLSKTMTRKTDHS